jgi:hypothetical protein
MVQQYAEEYYGPIARGSAAPDDPPSAAPLHAGSLREASSGARG